MINFEGEEVSFDEFINDLRTNHGAKNLLAPIDIQDLYMKHLHDEHYHGEHPIDDIF